MISERSLHLLRRMTEEAQTMRIMGPMYETRYQLRKRQLLCAAYGGSVRQVHLMAVKAKNDAARQP